MLLIKKCRHFPTIVSNTPVTMTLAIVILFAIKFLNGMEFKARPAPLLLAGGGLGRPEYSDLGLVFF